MNNNVEPGVFQPDPAAVLGCAISLRESCFKQVADYPILNLSDSYSGMDQFMRELMRIGTLFEEWSCQHIVFEAITDVWPYLMEDKFGDACLNCMLPTALAEFDRSDCLRVALQLRLPIEADGTLRAPIDVRAANPVNGSTFLEFRIQTVREDVYEGVVVPFTTEDNPFDVTFGQPYFALYGVGKDGLSEHIADGDTYSDIVSLARKLVPAVVFPNEPVCFQ